MALRGVKPELIEKRFKAFFYGAAKVGKTTAAIQFPKPYLIDTERGAENKKYVDLLKNSGGVIFQTSDFDELIKEVNALLTEKHEFKTLIIDPLTTVYNDLIDKMQIALKKASKDKDSTGSEFGRHYTEANKKMKNLYNLLLRLDMNVIITSHAKDQLGENMVKLGQTFDCYKKLDYLFDLILEVQKRGKERVAIIKGTRLEGFPEDETIIFNYDEIANRYDRAILERDCTPQKLATPEQVAELKRLIEFFNLPEEIWQKWLDKANSEKFEEMPCDTIEKCIDYLKSKLQGEAA